MTAPATPTQGTTPGSAAPRWLTTAVTATVVTSATATVTTCAALLHSGWYHAPMRLALVGAWAVTCVPAAYWIRFYSAWAHHRNQAMAGRAEWVGHWTLKRLVLPPAAWDEQDPVAGETLADSTQDARRRWWPLYPWIAEKGSLWLQNGGPTAWREPDEWWKKTIADGLVRLGFHGRGQVVPDEDTADTTPLDAPDGAEEATARVLVGSDTR